MPGQLFMWPRTRDVNILMARKSFRRGLQRTDQYPRPVRPRLRHVRDEVEVDVTMESANISDDWSRQRRPLLRWTIGTFNRVANGKGVEIDAGRKHVHPNLPRG